MKKWFYTIFVMAMISSLSTLTYAAYIPCNSFQQVHPLVQGKHLCGNCYWGMSCGVIPARQVFSPGCDNGNAGGVLWTSRASCAKVGGVAIYNTQMNMQQAKVIFDNPKCEFSLLKNQ